MGQGSSRIGTILLSITFLSVLAVLIMMFGARLDFWEPIVGYSRRGDRGSLRRSDLVLAVSKSAFPSWQTQAGGSASGLRTGVANRLFGKG